MKKRFSEELIIGFLREAEAGLPVKEVCRRSACKQVLFCTSRYGDLRADLLLLERLGA